MSQTAARVDFQPEPVERSIAEQLALNRGVVAAADDEGLRDYVHPALWERLGPLRTLRRRSGLREVA